MGKLLVRKIFSTQTENFVFRNNQIRYENATPDTRENYFIEELNKFLTKFMGKSYLVKSTYDGECYAIKKADFMRTSQEFNFQFSKAFLTKEKSREVTYLRS